eukprot:TRINITY_DN9269_c0_g2_i2.p2 TRINITY_DN9269_c0_g2~~TRINITY_DN9269_c0_g2_i2.p2  ORF type:complete len:237 (-),score=-22.24 TRINITY_DN9269_c0_g2_i2:156-866(-)
MQPLPRITCLKIRLVSAIDSLPLYDKQPLTQLQMISTKLSLSIFRTTQVHAPYSGRVFQLEQQWVRFFKGSAKRLGIILMRQRGSSPGQPEGQAQSVFPQVSIETVNSLNIRTHQLNKLQWIVSLCLPSRQNFQFYGLGVLSCQAAAQAPIRSMQSTNPFAKSGVLTGVIITTCSRYQSVSTRSGINGLISAVATSSSGCQGMHHEGVKFVQIRRNTTCSGINDKKKKKKKRNKSR